MGGASRAVEKRVRSQNKYRATRSAQQVLGGRAQAPPVDGTETKGAKQEKIGCMFEDGAFDGVGNVADPSHRIAPNPVRPEPLF